MILIGVDPGLSGGIAWQSTEAHAVKMPATEHDIATVFAGFEMADCFAYLEKVHSMPEQGVKSSFTFGQNYGSLRMALVANAIPFEDVTPQKWMGHYGLKRRKDESKTAWKNRLKAKAQQLFPRLKVTLATADALLIAEYGRRLRTGEAAA